MDGEEKGFGVAGGGERAIGVGVVLEFPSEVEVVVDLAVEGDGERSPIAPWQEEGLSASFGVEDGESAVSDGAMGLGPQAGAVRAAMREAIAHASEVVFRDGEASGAGGDDAEDAAHREFLSTGGAGRQEVRLAGPAGGGH